MSTAELTVSADDVDVTRIDSTAVAVITKSEVEAQIDAAHRYPRSIKRFMQEAVGLATITRDVAKSCMYSLPRGLNDDGSQKIITGPSVRLAEIAASAYGNLHAGTRVVEEGEMTVTAQGVAWDIEKNLRVTVETQRSIVGKKGKRFKQDMVVVTGNAAASIAFRNAIFRVVPKAYIQAIYDKAKAVAVGDIKTLAQTRREQVDVFVKMGISQERVLARLGKPGLADVGIDDVEMLIGLENALRGGEMTLDEVFPVAKTSGSAQPGEAAELEAKIRADAASTEPVKTSEASKAPPSAVATPTATATQVTTSPPAEALKEPAKPTASTHEMTTPTREAPLPVPSKTPPQAGSSDALFGEEKPAPAGGWDASYDRIVLIIQERMDGQQKAEARQLAAEWAAKAPPSYALKLTNLWRMATGGEKLEVHR